MIETTKWFTKVYNFSYKQLFLYGVSQSLRNTVFTFLRRLCNKLLENLYSFPTVHSSINNPTSLPFTAKKDSQSWLQIHNDFMKISLANASDWNKSLKQLRVSLIKHVRNWKLLRFVMMLNVFHLLSRTLASWFISCSSGKPLFKLVETAVFRGVFKNVSNI